MGGEIKKKTRGFVTHTPCSRSLRVLAAAHAGVVATRLCEKDRDKSELRGALQGADPTVRSSRVLLSVFSFSPAHRSGKILDK